MGLCGFAIAWQKAHMAFAAPELARELLAAIATAAFVGAIKRKAICLPE